jgi:hypothetical protein
MAGTTEYISAVQNIQLAIAHLLSITDVHQVVKLLDQALEKSHKTAVKTTANVATYVYAVDAYVLQAAQRGGPRVDRQAYRKSIVELGTAVTKNSFARDVGDGSGLAPYSEARRDVCVQEARRLTEVLSGDDIFRRIRQSFPSLNPSKLGEPEYNLRVAAAMVAQFGGIAMVEGVLACLQQYGLDRWTLLALHLEWVLAKDHGLEALVSAGVGSDGDGEEDRIIAYLSQHELEAKLQERPLELARRLVLLAFTAMSGKRHVLLVVACRMIDGAMRKEIADRPENKKVVAKAFPGLSSKRLKAFKLVLKVLHKVAPVPLTDVRVDFHALMAPVIARARGQASTAQLEADVQATCLAELARVLTFENIADFEKLFTELQVPKCAPCAPSAMLCAFVDRQLTGVLASLACAGDSDSDSGGASSISESESKSSEVAATAMFQNTLGLLEKLDNDDVVAVALKFHGSGPTPTPMVHGVESKAPSETAAAPCHESGAKQLPAGMKLKLLEASLATLKKRDNTDACVATLEALFAVQNAIAYVYNFDGEDGPFDASVVAMLKDSSHSGKEDRQKLSKAAVQWALCLGTDAVDVLKLARKLRLIPGCLEEDGDANTGVTGTDAAAAEAAAMEDWLLGESTALFKSLSEMLVRAGAPVLREVFSFCCRSHRAAGQDDGQWPLCQKETRAIVAIFEGFPGRSIQNLILHPSQSEPGVWKPRQLLLMMGNVYAALTTARNGGDADDENNRMAACTTAVNGRFWTEVVYEFLHTSSSGPVDGTAVPAGLGGSACELWAKALASQVFLDLLRRGTDGSVEANTLANGVEDDLVFNEFVGLAGDEWPEEPLTVNFESFKEVSVKALLYVQLCQSLSSAAKGTKSAQGPPASKPNIRARLQNLSFMLCRWELRASANFTQVLQGVLQQVLTGPHLASHGRPLGRALLSQFCAVLSFQSTICGNTRGTNILGGSTAADTTAVLDFANLFEGHQNNPQASPQLPSGCRIFPSPFSKCWAFLFRLLASKGGTNGRREVVHLMQSHAFGVLSAAHEATLVKTFDSKGLHILARKMQMLSPYAPSVNAALAAIFLGHGSETAFETVYSQQMDDEFAVLVLARCNIVRFWKAHGVKSSSPRCSPQLVALFLQTALTGFEVEAPSNKAEVPGHLRKA